MKRLLCLPFWLVFMLVVAGISTGVRAQGTLHTLFTNGPTAKRLNVVVLAEGYTTNQVNLFLADAMKAASNLLAQLPLQPYRSYFNAYAIFVASAESGSDHPSYPRFRNTYFNSTYESSGIAALLTIPSDGQAKVNTLLANLLPEYDLAVLLVNDPEYGGSGGPTLITSVNVFSPEIIVHESGHTFAGLTDEYTNAFPGFTPVEKPNATAVTVSNAIKWRAWIPPGTAIPTPESPANSDRIGLFQGAQYRTTGWYRPKLDCKMRSLFVPFCEVCSEQIVKSIYTSLRPIESFAPAVVGLTIVSTQAVSFTVNTLRPLSHELGVQWFTNDLAVLGATNPIFQVAPKLLGKGVHTIKAVVQDPTPLVRNDPANLLRQTNSWNLTVSLNELTLVAAHYVSPNSFRFTVTGMAPQGFVIQVSTNMTNWTPLATNTLSAGKFDFTNSSLPDQFRRYYRTISPP